MWAFLWNSPVVWVLLVFFFFSVVIIIEKIWLFSQISSEKDSFKLLSNVQELLKDSITQKKIDQARALCLSANKKNIAAVLIRRVLDHHKQDTSWLIDMTQREREMRLPYLEKRVNLLGTFSALAPLMGLLGTVLGIITAFLAKNNVSPQMQSLFLSQGISQALITTALGLFIAIPSLFFYNFFISKIERIDSNLSLLSRGIISHLKMKKK